MTNGESLRVKALRFLEQLKDGITIQRENLAITYAFDPSADYDLYVKKVNNSITMMVYSRNARCTIRVFEDKNGEWHLRSIICRR